MTDLREKVDEAIARALLVKETEEPRDALPYSSDFERLHALYGERSGSRISKSTLMQAFFRIGKKGGVSGRRATVHAPKVGQKETVFVGKQVGEKLAARASLVYTVEFDAFYEEYSKRFGKLSKLEFWLLLDKVAKKAKGEEWKLQLRKARESACLAVELYNKPLSTFRTQGFVALMVIAWTSLYHAFYYRLGIIPKYPRAENENEDKYWDLSKCLKVFYGGEASPSRSNLEFFIGLRNEIEHRSLPEIDHSLFGHCQAMVMNFEDLLVGQFGQDASLAESLALAVQFSRAKSAEQCEAIRRQLQPLPEDIAKFIENHRANLSEEIRDSMEYCYKVFIVPKIANHEKSSDLAVEFVPFDPDEPSGRKFGEKLTALIKEKQVPVANKDRLKAGVVCEKVLFELRAKGFKSKFVASYHHAAAVEFYKIRPSKDSKRPDKTITKYCVYDEAHGDYVYTVAWVEFLVEELQKEGQYERILEAKRRNR